MTRELVAVAACRRADDAGPGDLYPDPDAGPLRAALESIGSPSVMVAWDDPSIAWEEFARVVISSTWDSVDRPAEYLAWIRRAAAATRLVNDAAFVEWNLDKRYLKDLEAAGVPVIPTTWIEPGDRWKPPTSSDFVVKPSISAGGRGTARYGPGDAGARPHVAGLLAAGQVVMVQEYLAAIDTEGELNAVFIAGRYSHAVTKSPVLQAGEGVVTERPWERMAWAGRADPTDDQLAVARAAMVAVRRRIGADPAYGRVDLIRGPTGGPLVLELELIDPYLSLDVVPAGAESLARVVLAEAR